MSILDTIEEEIEQVRPHLREDVRIGWRPWGEEPYVLLVWVSDTVNADAKLYREGEVSQAETTLLDLMHKDPRFDAFWVYQKHPYFKRGTS